MILLKEVNEILDKYYLGVNVPDEYKTIYLYLTEHPNKESEDFEHPIINDGYLMKKYKDRIPQGWYGFAIGNPTPMNWYIVIEKILDFLVKKDDTFKIHQIKTKWGGIRFYVQSREIEDIYEIEDLIEDKLYSEKMIY